MKNGVALLGLMVLIGQAQAQNNQSSGQAQAQASSGQPKATVIYDERSNELVEVQPQVVQAQPQAAPAPQPIYILNTQKAQSGIQEQPTTVVQDAPLKQSPADQMRKQRQESEAATEDGIVQTLEKARMDDELKRREKFNNALNPPPPTPTPAPAAPIVQQQVVPVQIAAPAAEEEEVVVPKKKKKKVIEEEDATTMDLKAAIPAEEPKKQKNYLEALVGQGNYGGVANIRANGSAGVALGIVTPDRVTLEGSFLYGNYDVEDMFVSTPYDPILVEMKQYNIAAALKYAILPGKLTPTAGALVSYTRRSYSYDAMGADWTSDAIDTGLSGGVDFAVSDNVSVGLDYRYYWNLSSRRNTGQPESIVYKSGRSDLESLSYSTITLGAKMLF